MRLVVVNHLGYRPSLFRRQQFLAKVDDPGLEWTHAVPPPGQSPGNWHLGWSVRLPLRALVGQVLSSDQRLPAAREPPREQAY